MSCSTEILLGVVTFRLVRMPQPILYKKNCGLNLLKSKSTSRNTYEKLRRLDSRLQSTKIRPRLGQAETNEHIGSEYQLCLEDCTKVGRRAAQSWVWKARPEQDCSSQTWAYLMGRRLILQSIRHGTKQSRTNYKWGKGVSKQWLVDWWLFKYIQDNDAHFADNSCLFACDRSQLIPVKLDDYNAKWRENFRRNYVELQCFRHLFAVIEPLDLWDLRCYEIAYSICLINSHQFED